VACATSHRVLGKCPSGEAAKPSEAIEKLQSEDWDVVVLDISLPGRGGLDALREIKRLRPAVPVLVPACTPRITMPCVPCARAPLAT